MTFEAQNYPDKDNYNVECDKKCIKVSFEIVGPATEENIDLSDEIQRISPNGFPVMSVHYQDDGSATSTNLRLTGDQSGYSLIFGVGYTNDIEWAALGDTSFTATMIGTAAETSGKVDIFFFNYKRYTF